MTKENTVAEHAPKYDLNLEEAKTELFEISERNQTQTAQGIRTEQLQGIEPEVAFDLGYATALHDLNSLTGPDPMEIEIVEVEIPREVQDFPTMTIDTKDDNA